MFIVAVVSLAGGGIASSGKIGGVVASSGISSSVSSVVVFIAVSGGGVGGRGDGGVSVLAGLGNAYLIW